MFGLIVAIIFLTLIPCAGFALMAYRLYDGEDRSLFWISAAVSAGFLFDAVAMFLVYSPYV